LAASPKGTGRCTSTPRPLYAT